MATKRNTKKATPNNMLTSKDINADNPFKKIWEKFEEIVEDIATVDVSTFQGDVKIDLPAGEKFNPRVFFENLQGKLADGSSLTLVAHTHVEFDLDCVLITKTDADAKALEAHNSAVKAAVDARMSVLRAVKDLIP